MLILADTNVLLRTQNPSHPHNALAVRALSQLLVQGHTLCVALQNIIEFRAVATRGLHQNRLRLSIASATAEIQDLSRLFQFLPAHRHVLAEWQMLVHQYSVVGKQSHDAHLVATMMVHGVEAILTFNVQDFVRFASITIIDPHKV